MLIALEGLPGSGKSTQSRMLRDTLKSTGSAVHLPDNRTRTATTLGTALLDLFATGDPFARHESVVTTTMLAAAIRAETYATDIAPALGSGATVIEDRGLHTMYSYSLATLLQQHHAQPTPAIAWLTACAAWSGPTADLSIWLRVPPHESIARAEARGRRTYTREQRAYLHYVHHAYTALADHDPALIPLDAADLDPAQIHRAVLALIAAHQTQNETGAVPGSV